MDTAELQRAHLSHVWHFNSQDPPLLVRDLAGTDAVTSAAASIERGYVLHRIDLEKVRVLDARAARRDQDLGVYEQRVASMAAIPDFWDSSGGRVLLIA